MSKRKKEEAGLAVDIREVRKHLEERERQKQEEWERMRLRAFADAAAIISMAIERYRPLRIYQWGSVITPGQFRDYSDIDIAVEGLSGPLDILHLLRDAEQLTTFPVHMVELDRTEAVHAESIRKEGKLVYELKKTNQ